MCAFLFMLQVESADKEVQDVGQGDGGCGDDEREGGDVGQGGDDDQANQGNEGEEQ